MFERFFPDEYLDSAYAVDYEKLYQQGYRGVEPFAREVGVKYIEMAAKPSRRGYQRAMERLGTNPGNTVFIGDQLFTDILGAKNAGLKNILVKPIHPKEEIQIVLKRYLEKFVLHFYTKEEKNS